MPLVATRSGDGYLGCIEGTYHTNGRLRLMEISVVIITRNEGQTIGQTLEMLVKELENRDAEIVLVDSASSDDTITIASGYPVRILRLEPSPLLSPAAGRYIGTKCSHGKFIFFIDGDMIPIAGWLTKGLEEMRESSLAAVAGRIHFVPPGEELSRDHPDDFPLGEIAGSGGSAIYRRISLEECGTFNPYLQGEEEVELGYRLRRGGYHLRRIAHPMAYHIDKVRGLTPTDQKARYHAGVGQILRRYPGSNLARRLMRATAPLFVQQIVVLGTPLGIVVSYLAGWHVVAAFSSVAAVLAMAAVMVWKGPTNVMAYLRFIFLASFHMVRGFIRGLPEGAGFERRVRYTISEGRPLSGSSAAPA